MICQSQEKNLQKNERVKFKEYLRGHPNSGMAARKILLVLWIRLVNVHVPLHVGIICIERDNITLKQWLFAG